MFDLEIALAVWRKEMRLRGADEAALDELEDHLHVEFSMLHKSGLPALSAWQQAMASLGTADEVCRELTKVAPLRLGDRAILVTLASIPAIAAVALIATVVLQGREVLRDSLLALHVATITFAYVVGLSAAVAAAYATLRTFLSNQPMPQLIEASSRLVRWSSAAVAPLAATGFFLGAVWGKMHGFDFVDFDSLREMGAIAATLCFLPGAVATWSRSISERAVFTFAILGGGFIMLGWFGALAAEGAVPAALGFGGFLASVLVALVFSTHLRPAVSDLTPNR